MFCSAESLGGIVAGEIGNQRISRRLWQTPNGTASQGPGVTTTASRMSPSADSTERLNVPVSGAISASVCGPSGQMSKASLPPLISPGAQINRSIARQSVRASTHRRSERRPQNRSWPCNEAATMVSRLQAEPCIRRVWTNHAQTPTPEISWFDSGHWRNSKRSCWPRHLSHTDRGFEGQAFL